MKISSSAFQNNQPIPIKYTCDGENINPPLSFDIRGEKVAVSYVLIMDDPDAPGGIYTHWLVWNISSNCTDVFENSVPLKGIEGVNSSGSKGYMGPCPPFGVHRYVFKLYALDSKIDLPEGSNRGQLENVMKGHVISQAELVGLYSRVM